MRLFLAATAMILLAACETLSLGNHTVSGTVVTADGSRLPAETRIVVNLVRPEVADAASTPLARAVVMTDGTADAVPFRVAVPEDQANGLFRLTLTAQADRQGRPTWAMAEPAALETAEGNVLVLAPLP